MGAFETVAEKIGQYRNDMVEFQKRIIPCAPVGPDNGGQGEWGKGQIFEEELRSFCNEVKTAHAPDDRVAGGKRPNIAGIIYGNDRSRTLWLVGHTDVVPAGDLSAWKTQPFEAHIIDGKIYGRGSEDNNQGGTAILFAGKAIKAANVIPPVNVGLLYVADEETANDKGICHVLDSTDWIRPNDAAFIPDGGFGNCVDIEVAEKAIYHIRATVIGRAVHAFNPSEGINSARAAARLITRMDELYKIFPDEDPLFEPGTSTFEPTKHEENVPNLNAVPGKDVCYWDCRLLPSLDTMKFMQAFRKIAQEVAAETKTTIAVEEVKSQGASKTNPESQIVKNSIAAVSAVYGKKAKSYGIGGGSIAYFLRARDIPAAVYGNVAGTLHTANEYCIIDNMVGDSKVMAHLALAGC